MIDKIEEKIEKEINKILEKEDLSIDEINFLIGEVTRLELERGREQSTEDMRKAMELILKRPF